MKKNHQTVAETWTRDVITLKNLLVRNAHFARNCNSDAIIALCKREGSFEWLNRPVVEERMHNEMTVHRYALSEECHLGLCIFLLGAHFKVLTGAYYSTPFHFQHFFSINNITMYHDILHLYCKSRTDNKPNIFLCSHFKSLQPQAFFLMHFVSVAYGGVDAPWWCWATTIYVSFIRHLDNLHVCMHLMIGKGKIAQKRPYWGEKKLRAKIKGKYKYLASWSCTDATASGKRFQYLITLHAKLFLLLRVLLVCCRSPGLPENLN